MRKEYYIDEFWEPEDYGNKRFYYDRHKLDLFLDDKERSLVIYNKSGNGGTHLLEKMYEVNSNYFDTQNLLDYDGITERLTRSTKRKQLISAFTLFDVMYIENVFEDENTELLMESLNNFTDYSDKNRFVIQISTDKEKEYVRYLTRKLNKKDIMYLDPPDRRLLGKMTLDIFRRDYVGITREIAEYLVDDKFENVRQFERLMRVYSHILFRNEICVDSSEETLIGFFDKYEDYLDLAVEMVREKDMQLVS